MVEKNFELSVSIGDVSKALTALRTYGLSAQVAEDVIANESEVAIYDHGIIPKFAISPSLIEMFGEQHIDDAISYCYLFMDEYDLPWANLNLILSALLNVFRSEELILNPEKIRFFINSLDNKMTWRMREKASEDEANISRDDLLSEVLSYLTTEDIISMATDPLDYECIDNADE